jgi:hypothetical protein
MHLIVKTAIDHVAALRLALLAPSAGNLQSFLPALTETAASLDRIQRELAARPNRDPELRSDLKALRRDLRAAGKLIQHGAAFWEAWARRFGAATGGYTPSGEPRPVAASGTISIQG